VLGLCHLPRVDRAPRAHARAWSKVHVGVCSTANGWAARGGGPTRARGAAFPPASSSSTRGPRRSAELRHCRRRRVPGCRTRPQRPEV